MQGWQSDKQWSDRFMPEIKSILGRYLISEAPIEEDQERNTDLIVLKLDAVRIACRLRRPNEFFRRNVHEFTIRYSRPNGNQTELAKIRHGWGDYMFYGFADRRLVAWSLLSLDIFREWYRRQKVYRPSHEPGEVKPNKDKSSELIVFKYAQLPRDFLIARNPGPMQYQPLFKEPPCPIK